MTLKMMYVFKLRRCLLNSLTRKADEYKAYTSTKQTNIAEN